MKLLDSLTSFTGVDHRDFFFLFLMSFTAVDATRGKSGRLCRRPSHVCLLSCASCMAAWRHVRPAVRAPTTWGSLANRCRPIPSKERRFTILRLFALWHWRRLASCLALRVGCLAPVPQVGLLSWVWLWFVSFRSVIYSPPVGERSPESLLLFYRPLAVNSCFLFSCFT